MESNKFKINESALKSKIKDLLLKRSKVGAIADSLCVLFMEELNKNKSENVEKV